MHGCMATPLNGNGYGNGGKVSWVAGMLPLLLAAATAALVMWTAIVSMREHQVFEDSRIDNLNERLKQLELWQFHIKLRPPS